MNLHEYQARQLFREFGLPVPPGELATSPQEAETIAQRYGGEVVVKAQVHAGGRGKAGGVRLAKTPRAARAAAEQILGITIKGLVVRKVLVAKAEAIAHEAYVGIVIDRARRAPVIMVCAEGGIDIEEVAAKTPQRIQRETIDPRYGCLAHQAARLAYRLYDDPARARAASAIIRKLYDAFVGCGASLAEINPLVTTPAGELAAIDAKMVVDDNELVRHRELAEWRDEESEEPAEVEARRAGLSYVKLDGDVGCCVNGAGLAMATMDLIQHYGGRPANFLDIGGSSSPDKVIAALSIITRDPHVRSILFNIFGGITRCDDVAQGIVAATSRHPLRIPLTIRLTGTNEEEAVRILEGAGFVALTDMDAAVRTAVERVKS
jgi:succinyl-CoA synthetase beta subunit